MWDLTEVNCCDSKNCESKKQGCFFLFQNMHCIFSKNKYQDARRGQILSSQSSQKNERWFCLKTNLFEFERFWPCGEPVGNKTATATSVETHQQHSAATKPARRAQEIQFSAEWKREEAEWSGGNTPEERLREQSCGAQAGSVAWGRGALPAWPFLRWSIREDAAAFLCCSEELWRPQGETDWWRGGGGGGWRGGSFWIMNELFTV